MREDLKTVLGLARKNAEMREDIALAQVAGSLLLPERPDMAYGQTSLWGHCCPQTQTSSFWWHRELADGRVLVVLGYVPGAGPAPTMVSAAIAACVRDMLLHDDVRDPSDVLDQASRVLEATVGAEHPLGLCVLEVSAGRDSLSWASLGQQAPVFVPSSVVRREPVSVDEHCRGHVPLDPKQRVLVLFGTSEDAALGSAQIDEGMEEGDLDQVGRRVLTSLLSGPESTVRAFVLLQRGDPAKIVAA